MTAFSTRYSSMCMKKNGEKFYLIIRFTDSLILLNIVHIYLPFFLYICTQWPLVDLFWFHEGCLFSFFPNDMFLWLTFIVIQQQKLLISKTESFSFSCLACTKLGMDNICNDIKTDNLIIKISIIEVYTYSYKLLL